jgi:hypothetical protein
MLILALCRVTKPLIAVFTLQSAVRFCYSP